MTIENSIYTEYVITLASYADLDSFYADMETDGGSEFLPSRVVEVKYRRKNSRNTHYLLTGHEAELIKKDPRVKSVTPAALLDKIVTPSYTKTADFYRGPTDTDQVVNWGLFRTTNGSQISGWGSDGNPSHVDTISYNALGQHVDVIVVDGHFTPDHPEFALNENGTGGSRVVQLDWNTLSEAAGLLDGNSHTVLTSSYVYTPYDSTPEEESANNHGCHVAGTIAGNTQGWAKKANIYNISPYAQYNPNVVDVNGWSLIMWDYIRAFHANKPINPLTGKKNPTICNCSYGNVVYFPYDYGSFSTGPITRVFYRGTWYGNPLVPLTDSDLLSYGLVPVNGVVGVPYYDPAVAAEIEDAIADGIIVVAAAGNNYTRMVLPNDADYYNRVAADINGVYYEQYCHQGMSPGATPNVVCVGAATARATETKSYFSNCGPRVDVFAPGEYVLSSVNVNGPIPDSRNLGYTLDQYSGTSMSSPQVTGVIACNLQTNPTLNQETVRNYVNLYSKYNQLAQISTVSNDLTNLQNANNRYLFFEAVGAPLSSILAVSSVSLPLKLPITPFTPVTFSGGKAPFNISIFPPLPAGLNFNTASGEITGNPTEFRTNYGYKVTVTDALSQVTEQTFYLEVTYPIVPDFTTVINTSTVVNKQYVEVSPYVPVFYNNGVAPVVFNLSNNLPNGLQFSTSTGQITGTPSVSSSSSSYTVTMTDGLRRVTTGSFNLTVLPSPKLLVTATNASYTFIKNVSVNEIKTVNAASGYGNYTYSISPGLPSGIVFNTNTSYLSGLPVSTSSNTVYTVQVRDSEGQRESTEFSITVASPPIISTAVITLVTATQYVTELNVTPVSANGGYGILKYHIAPDLPNSLFFNTGTGLLSGTPDSSIDQQYAVTVSDQSSQISTGTFRLTVFPSAYQITTSTINLVQWTPIVQPVTVGQLVSSTASSFSILEPLPQGLTLDSSSGKLSGIPSQSISTASFTLVVTSVDDRISAAKFNLYVAPTLTVTRGFITPRGNLFTTTEYSTVTSFISAVGTGTRFELLSGNLPPGLTLSSNGIITGTIIK